MLIPLGERSFVVFSCKGCLSIPFFLESLPEVLKRASVYHLLAFFVPPWVRRTGCPIFPPFLHLLICYLSPSRAWSFLRALGCLYRNILSTPTRLRSIGVFLRAWFSIGPLFITCFSGPSSLFSSVFLDSLQIPPLSNHFAFQNMTSWPCSSSLFFRPLSTSDPFYSGVLATQLLKNVTSLSFFFLPFEEQRFFSFPPLCKTSFLIISWYQSKILWAHDAWFSASLSQFLSHLTLAHPPIASLLQPCY